MMNEPWSGVRISQHCETPGHLVKWEERKGGLTSSYFLLRTSCLHYLGPKMGAYDPNGPRILAH